MFFGIFLSFSGFGTIPGILLIVFFIWSDLKTDIKNQNSTQNEIEFAKQHYDEETLNDMK